MYWDNKLGLVTDDQGDQQLHIPYGQCRVIVEMLYMDKPHHEIRNLFNITREQLGFIYVGYLNGEFSL